MRYWLVASFSVLMSACGGSPDLLTTDQVDEARTNLMNSLTSGFIIEQSQTFSNQLQETDTQVEEFCQSPDMAGFSQLQQQWRELMNTWAALQFARFGPWEQSLVDSRFTQVQFWPQKTAPEMYTRMQTLLDSSDSVAIGEFENYSVLVKGLPAMEFLLFGTQVTSFQNDTDGRRCEMLSSVVQLMQRIASDSAFAWEEYALVLQQTPNDEFTDFNSAIQVVAEGLWSGVERVKNNKLGDALGKNGETLNTDTLESIYAKHNTESLRSNLAALEQLLSNTTGFSAYLRYIGEASLADRLDIELDAALVTADQINSTVYDILSDTSAYSADYALLEQLYDDLTTLTKTVKYDLSAALAIEVGFNSDDGD